MTGLQFDDRLWVCGYCKAVAVDYPTMKEHREKRRASSLRDRRSSKSGGFDEA